MRQSVAITYLYLIGVGVILAHWKLQHLPHCPHFCSITCGFAVWHLPYTRVSRSCYAAVAASTAGVNVVLCVFLTPRVFDVVISRPWPIDVGQAPSPDLYADKFSYCLCHCHWHLCLQHYSIDPVLTHVLAFEFFSFISAMLMQFRFVHCKTARNRRKMRNSGAPVIVRIAVRVTVPVRIRVWIWIQTRTRIPDSEPDAWRFAAFAAIAELLVFKWRSRRLSSLYMRYR